jgi:WD40 repeat protein
MPSLLDSEEDAEDEEIEIRSAADLLPQTWSTQLDDYALDLRWSPDGIHLAALPSTGKPQIFNLTNGSIVVVPGHRGGNGSLAWSPDGASLATLGQDGILRIHDIAAGSSRELQLPRGWAERCAWNADGSLIAAAIGRTVQVIDAGTLEILHLIEGHSSTVTDLVWHPVLLDQLATASDGGARMWRLGQKEPFARIDDGVAAVLTTWSPDGRWVVTSDQTASVHLYDTKKRSPLYIQGFQTKIKAFAWQTGGAPDLPWLALGGGPSITVWPCFGKNGPRGATPLQLFGHIREVTALDFPKEGPYLASGGRDGFVFLWLPHHSDGPALIAREDSEITTARWSPDGLQLAYGTASGRIAIHTLVSS